MINVAALSREAKALCANLFLLGPLAFVNMPKTQQLSPPAKAGMDELMDVGLVKAAVEGEEVVFQGTFEAGNIGAACIDSPVALVIDHIFEPVCGEGGGVLLPSPLRAPP